MVLMLLVRECRDLVNTLGSTSSSSSPPRYIFLKDARLMLTRGEAAPITGEARLLMPLSPPPTDPGL